MLPDLLHDGARHLPEGYNERVRANSGEKMEDGEYQLDVRKKKTYEGHHMFEEVVQRGCRVPVLVDPPNTAGHGCEQLAIFDLSFQPGIGPKDS